MIAGRSVWSLSLILVLVSLTGCGPNDSEEHGPGRRGPITVKQTYSGSYPIDVVATTGMVADLVRNIGGERVKVTQLMREGVDPHLYQTSPSDLTLLTSADIVFYSGLHLEGKMADAFSHLARRKPAFAVAEYTDLDRLLDNGEGTHDPHLWFDVSLWSGAAGVVRDALKAFDPTNADEYQKRADAYQAKLKDLHEYVKKQIATIPKERRVLVTAHDAFRYFGRAYDMEVRGIQGISTEGEAGVKEINALVEFLANNKIKAVFVESSVPERNVKALLEGCRARGHQVVIGGELFSDAMGKMGTKEGTYEGMVRHNVDTIVKALK